MVFDFGVVVDVEVFPVVVDVEDFPVVGVVVLPPPELGVVVVVGDPAPGVAVPVSCWMVFRSDSIRVMSAWYAPRSPFFRSVWDCW